MTAFDCQLTSSTHPPNPTPESCTDSGRRESERVGGAALAELPGVVSTRTKKKRSPRLGTQTPPSPPTPSQSFINNEDDLYSAQSPKAAEA